MASISRLTPSIFSGSQELTLALANLNFDFSLVKVEAPSQFQALGASMSLNRRETAEHGKTHVTARKLGALFEGLVPSTPRLVAAYGTRVSSIANSPLFNPKAVSKDGMFSDYAGADGTSIWAAATSGSGAIAVHLLACMLARIWSPAEATSIWVEVVEGRKRKLQESTTTGEIMNLPTLLAAQVVLERDQLAEWDNSARAWLRRADQAKRKEQTQLMLILNNLSVPVNGKLGTYESVIDALKSALSAMEEILLGRPQSVRDGSLLLALSCWHIYPDMIVLGSQTISQNDKLVPENGTITLGLESSPSMGPSGIYWSLSLAHLRYYGGPVPSQRNYETASGRISIDQLLQVALGSVIGGWGYKGVDVIQASSVITSIRNNLTSLTPRKSKYPVSRPTLTDKTPLNIRKLTKRWCSNFLNSPNWITTLSDASSMLKTTKGLDRELYLKLVALGQGRAASFVDEKASHPPAIFGLSDFRSFVSLLEDEEDRIAILRKYAHRFFPNAKPWEVIIRYKPNDERLSRKPPVTPEMESHEQTDILKTEDTSSQHEELEDQRHGRSSKDDNSTPGEDSNEGGASSVNSEVPGSLGDEKSAPPSERCPSISETSNQDKSIPVVPNNATLTRLEEPQSLDIVISEPNNESAFEQNSIPNRRTEAKEQEVDTNDIDPILLDEDTTPMLTVETPADEIALQSIFPYSDPYEYALALPNRDFDGNETATLKFERWTDIRLPSPSCVSAAFPTQTRESMHPIELNMTFLGPKRTTASTDNTTDSTQGTAEIMEDILSIKQVNPFRDVEAVDRDARGRSTESSSIETVFEYFLGDPKTAAIYVESHVLAEYRSESRMPYWASKKSPLKKIIDMSDVKHALDIKAISSESLEAFLRDQSHKTYYRSLKALASMRGVYRMLTDATIDASITMKPIHASNWLKSHSNSQRTYFAIPFSRASSFACIAMYETGTLDLSTSVCENVFALASGDSLYIAAPLLCDPLEQPAAHEIRRIVGNIGRPGLCLLVPPSETQISQPKSDSWRVISRKPYDGVMGDYFAGTSMHLSFTDWCYPVDGIASGQGRRDVEAHIVESLISVHSHGTWIADLDILGALKRGCSQFDHEYYYKVDCPHTEKGSLEKLGEDMPDSIEITSIDSWEEFLERPDGTAVVRAHKNWLARLATAVLSVQRKDRVLVGEGICLHCYKDLAEVGGSAITDRILFIS